MISLFILSFFAALLLLYFSSISRNIEKENYALEKQIKFIEDQININEIEYSLYNNYDYLKKIKKIYFDYSIGNSVTRISYLNLKDEKLENFYTVGIK